MKRSIAIRLLLATLTVCRNNSASSATTHSEGDDHDHKGEARGPGGEQRARHATETKKGN